MTLEELVKKNSKDAAILERLLALYPEQKKNKAGYAKVLKQLRTLEPTKSKFMVGIKPVKDEDGDYHAVFGELINPIEEDDFQTFGLDFTPWSEWLSMRVHPSTMQYYTELDIIAHILWEMTWYGYDEAEIKKEGDELFELAAEAQAQHENK